MMNEFVLSLTVGNAVIAIGLCLLAYVMGALLKRPHIAHIVWLLVIVKLLTPPLFSIPIVESLPALSSQFLSVQHTPSGSTIGPSQSGLSAFLYQIDRANWIAIIWAVGSLLVLTVSIRKLRRFNRLLRTTIQPGIEPIVREVNEVCSRVGLKNPPTVCSTSSGLAPFVWWFGGDVLLVLPQHILDHISTSQLRGVIAHEIAHIKRKDHLVRWVEWFATVILWWNPILWMAKYHLRIQEELACDSVAIDCSQIAHREYAQALFEIVNLLASRTSRRPSFASQYTSGGQLKRRIEMIVSNKVHFKTPRWMMFAVVITGLVILPVGFGCQAESAITEADGTDMQASPKMAKADSSIVVADSVVSTLQLKEVEIQADWVPAQTDSVVVGIPTIGSTLKLNADLVEIEVPVSKAIKVTLQPKEVIREINVPVQESIKVKGQLNPKAVIKEIEVPVQEAIKVKGQLSPKEVIREIKVPVQESIKVKGKIKEKAKNTGN